MRFFGTHRQTVKHPVILYKDNKRFSFQKTQENWSSFTSIGSYFRLMFLHDLRIKIINIYRVHSLLRSCDLKLTDGSFYRWEISDQILSHA